MRINSILLLALSSFAAADASQVAAQVAPIPVQPVPFDARMLPRLKASAQAGNVVDQTRLGVMYLQGDGVPLDAPAGVGWFRKAADQGYVPAEGEMGVFYFYGTGVGQDYVAARNWFQKAAEQGYPQAQHQLGLMYAQGLGVSVDRIQAYKWLSLAANSDGNWKLIREMNHNQFVKDRDDLAHELTAEQVAKATDLLNDWISPRQAPEPQSAVWP